MTPAVVVMAYNRPEALRRLLDSLLRAIYPRAPVPLVISIDPSVGPLASSVEAIAEACIWPFGKKEVVKHSRHLGLVAHFHACGRLAQDHGAAIVLEDDLTVAPPFFDFTTQVLERYSDDSRIAGFCLYGLSFNGYTHEPFLPLHDGNEVFFLRVPYTQGLAFTASQWQAFESFSSTADPGPHPDLHHAFDDFGPDEWFPAFAYYLALTGRFFCFPRISLTAGWGDAGTHFQGASSWFQTPTQLCVGPANLPAFDEALAVYDSFFELLPEKLRSIAPDLPGVEFDADINGTKEPRNLRHDYVLTTRFVRQAVRSFGLTMYPAERNVIENVPGDAIALARREDVYWDRVAGLEARRRLHAHAWARDRPSWRRDAGFLAGRILTNGRRWWHNNIGQTR